MPVTMPADGNLVVVEAIGGKLRQLEKRRAGIDQSGDAVARQQLVAREVTLARALATAQPDFGDTRAQIVDQCAHRRGIGW